MFATGGTRQYIPEALEQVPDSGMLFCGRIFSGIGGDDRIQKFPEGTTPDFGSNRRKGWKVHDYDYFTIYRQYNFFTDNFIWNKSGISYYEKQEYEINNNNCLYNWIVC
jgi:hypothetical protein